MDRSVVVLGIYGYMRRSRARRSPQKGSTVTESNQGDDLLEDDAMTAASHRNRIDVLEKSEKEARSLANIIGVVQVFRRSPGYKLKLKLLDQTITMGTSRTVFLKYGFAMLC